jgi:hypothetical protein
VDRERRTRSRKQETEDIFGFGGYAECLAVNRRPSLIAKLETGNGVEAVAACQQQYVKVYRLR